MKGGEIMFKKVVTIIFTVALALSLFCIPSYADSTEPFDLADATKQSLLTYRSINLKKGAILK